MPDDYNHTMSDLEYKKYKLKQSIESANIDFLTQEIRVKKKNEIPDNFPGQRKFECNVSELCDSDSDINGGDREDNLTLNSDDDLDKSLSLDGDNARRKIEDDDFNMNVSFLGGYVPNTDLTRVDKGQGNP